MALSNIRREPRREITESLVGVVLLIVPAWLDYRFAVAFHNATLQEPNGACPIGIGLIVGPVLLALGILGISALLYVTHAAGEWLCDWLDDFGLRLRPIQRYR